MLSDNFVSRGL